MASSDLFVTRKNRGGTWMTNDVVWGVRLSAPTLGLFVYMLSMPPHAPKTRDSMSGHFGLGRRAVATALKELEVAGLRYRFRVAGGRGKFATVTVLSSEPISLEEAFLEVPDSVRGDVVACVSARADGEEAIRLDADGHPILVSSDVEDTPGAETQDSDNPGLSTSEPSGVPVPVPRSEMVENRQKQNATSGEPVSDGGLSTGGCSPGCRLSSVGERYPLNQYPSSLRSEGIKSNQPTRPETPADDSGLGVVGVDGDPNGQPGVVGATVVATHTPAPAGPDSRVPQVQDTPGDSAGDAVVVASCVPERLAGFIAPSRLEAVARDLRAALDAGWSAAQVYRVLNSNPLPGDTRNAGALVAYRIRQIAACQPVTNQRAARGYSMDELTGLLTEAQSVAPDGAGVFEARIRDDPRLSRAWRQMILAELPQTVAK
ncbi:MULTISPECIES: hypothetical protein [Actinotignum]|uniref:hypothetical protein n=1 Tax=Actinotignum TaxID=1653174 RepID=UPI0011778D19|nr:MULTISPECIES: hypothetical protein [Actinotignum]MDY5127784.1 hypothetical protein [Actinotignum sp. SLA_B059]